MKRFSLVLVAVLLEGFLVGCSQESPETASPPLVKAVRVAPVVEASETMQLSFPGVVRARERSLVAPQVAGIVERRPASLGDVVARGDLLAVLRNPQLDPARDASKAEVDALRSQRDQARQDLDRAQALLERQLVAQDAVDQARTALLSVEASLRRASAQADGADASAGEQTLRAAHDGVVVAVFAEPGDFLAAGQPLLSLSNPQRLEVALQIPVHVAASLQEGERIAVSGLYATAHFATLAENPRSASAANGLARITLALDPENELNAGDPVEVALPLRTASRRQVPLQALRAVGGVPPVTVMTVRDGVASAVTVTPLELQGDQAIIDDKMDVGTLVITEAPSALRSGDRVRVLP